jgi:hypothetical protein
VQKDRVGDVRGRSASAASAGGAAGAGGVGLQNRVFAWAAAAMVAEQPMARDLVAGVVVRVGAQTGFELDDVAVQTDADNFALFQVKAGLKLGKTNTSPLAKALGQAVEQYLNGRLPVDGGTERAFDSKRDALVLCTDGTAPATIREHLVKSVAKTSTQPPGTPLLDKLTKAQRTVLETVLDHVRRLWVASGHTAPDDEQLRAFLRALRVITIDANDGERDHAVSVGILNAALPAKGDSDRAWPVLVAEGQAASVAQNWRDRAGVGVALARQYVYLSPPTRHAGDIAKLRELSEANIQTLKSEATLPVPGGLYVNRSVSARLIDAAGDENVLVVGEAGAGKSAVGQEFAVQRSGSHEVIVLRAADVAGVNRVQLNAPLTVVLRAWTGRPGVILIDGVDALRGAEDRAFLGRAVADLRGSRWQIVATVRTFDVRHNQDLQQAFAGPPLSDDPAQVDRRLAGVRHLLVGDFTDAELDAAVTASLELAALLAEASAELKVLLRNPFNLRLASRLAQLPGGREHTTLLAVRSRVDLLEAYWRWRVHNQDRTARDALLARLCRNMVSNRSLRTVEAEPTVAAADSAAVEAMLSEGVLSGDDGLFAAGPRVLSFSHNILFDYAAALYLLYDPLDQLRLLDTLDADPSLPLVARPSFELLADLLWKHRDAGAFWPLCLALTGSRHVLASLAFAARLLQLIRATDDVVPLAPEPGRTDRPTGLLPEQELVRQLTGALRAPAVLADPAAAVVPLAALARRLAANAVASYADAALAADLLQILQSRAPLRPDEPGADERGQAIADLLDGCRTDPRRMERLAEAAARQLPHVLGVGAAARGAVGRLLDDNAALREWGGTVLIWLADAVIPTVSEDPELARRLAVTILTFREARDEQVSLIPSAVLPMSMSRRQNAEHAVYRLGQAFDRLCVADLRVAAEIFCYTAEDDTPSSPASGNWPISTPAATGWLSYGRDFATIAHDAGESMATALTAALVDADPVEVQQVVGVLVERLRSTEAWAALMSTGDPVRLSLVLLPVLDSGALLAHPETHSAAATLLAAVAGHQPALAGRLESAVLQAHVLIDRNRGSQRTKDVLIGCLRPETITSAAFKARLDELGPAGPPQITPRMRPTAEFGSWSTVDRLADLGIELEASVAAAARMLDDTLTAATNGGARRPEAERELHDRFTDADAAFSACQNLPAELELLLLRAADLLAGHPAVSPGSSLGKRVLALLTTAAASSDAGGFLQ